MSDGTTTTGARCEGCGEMGVMTCFECMRQEDDGIRAENARLRERVAALTKALLGTAERTFADGRQPCWCLEFTHDQGERTHHNEWCLNARSALAQAGEGGAA